MPRKAYSTPSSGVARSSFSRYRFLGLLGLLASLLILAFRRCLRSWCIGLLDHFYFYEFYKHKGLGKRPYFHERGWGNKADYAKVSRFRPSRIPPVIRSRDVTFRDWIVSKDGLTRRRELTFLTPTPQLLQKGAERTVICQWIERVPSKDDDKPESQTCVIIPPATGDEGFRMRARTVTKGLVVKKGFTVILTQVPGAGPRRDQATHPNIAYEAVPKHVAVCFAHFEEIRALLDYLRRRDGFRRFILAGMSHGGMLVAMLARCALFAHLPPGTPRPSVGCVPFMSPESLLPSRMFRAKAGDWKKLGETDPPASVCKLGKDKREQLMGYYLAEGDRYIAASRKFSRRFKEAQRAKRIAEARLKGRQKKKLRMTRSVKLDLESDEGPFVSCVTNVIQIVARHDRVVWAVDTDALRETFLRLVGKDAFERRVVSGGHFHQFTSAEGRDAFVKAIVDVDERLRAFFPEVTFFV